MSQIDVGLQSRRDKNDNEFFVGVLKMPANIELHDGFKVLIWLNTRSPRLVLRPMDANYGRQEESESDDET